MRYYSFTLNANAEQIKENTQINLRQYDYNNTFAAMNSYMYQNLDNDVYFFVYREEENATCDIARLMISEKQMTITGAAMNKLRKIFDIVREKKDYGNGRFVRKTLEETEMNLAGYDDLG